MVNQTLHSDSVSNLSTAIIPHAEKILEGGFHFSAVLHIAVAALHIPWFFQTFSQRIKTSVFIHISCMNHFPLKG